ncbi:MAG: hypothetical protein IPG34_19425 [Rhodocyclaceae bacterium]|nr:hypothetical protein [Rhodocyclaceae bacterium]
MTRLNALFARIVRTLDSERRFTADTAHELRTPLAAIVAQAQVASGARDGPKRAHALTQLAVSAERAQPPDRPAADAGPHGIGPTDRARRSAALTSCCWKTPSRTGPGDQQGIALEISERGPAPVRAMRSCCACSCAT